MLNLKFPAYACLHPKELLSLAPLACMITLVAPWAPRRVGPIATDAMVWNQATAVKLIGLWCCTLQMYWPQTDSELASTISRFQEEVIISNQWHSCLEFHWPCSRVFCKENSQGIGPLGWSDCPSAMSSLRYRMTFIDEASEPLAPVNERAKSCPPVMHHKIGFD